MVVVAVVVAVSGSDALAAGGRKIAEYAVSPMTRNQYPDTFRLWGSAWVKRINGFMPRAAQKVAESPECDEVSYVGLSMERSTPKKRAVLFVDCSNGKRFYVAEEDLASAAPIASKHAKTAAISDSDALAACENAIKPQLAVPLSFRRHRLDTSVRRTTTGNIAVYFSFDAKNALGARLPHEAYCTLDDTGRVSTTVK